jgi:glycosyltransferase involved in cell wall biosynthesis
VKEGAMPRVCIVRRDYYPQSPHVHRDAQALVADGFDVDVVCLRRPGQKAYERLDGVGIYRLPIAKRRAGLLRYLFEYSVFFLLAFVALTFLSLRRRYDSVEIDTMPDFLVFAAIVPKLMGTRVVLYLFECMPELFQESLGLSYSHPVVRLLRLNERYASRFAHHVIYCGPGYRDIQGPRAGKLMQSSVVLNVPVEEIFAPEKVTPPKADLRGEPLRIITHGSLLERYGISTIIKAARLVAEEIPRVEVTIAGDDEHRQALEQETRELGVEKFVTFIGRVPHEQVVDLIARADIGVAAFWPDWMLSNKLFEYLAMQRPVVHSATKFTMDFCRNDEVLFFTPGDERELAERLLWLYHHPEERLAMVTRANQLYEKCRWGVMRETYLDVHRQPAQASQAGGAAD